MQNNHDHIVDEGQTPAQPIKLGRADQRNSTAALLTASAVFFGLGFVMAYLIFDARDGQPGNVELQAALAGTLRAMTPSPTPPPTRVPTQLTIADHNPWIGPEDAPVTIVEFSDYQCPFCLRFHATVLPSLRVHYGDLIRLVYREFPVIGGQSSAEAGAAAQCAYQQGRFWEFTDRIWENQASDTHEPLTGELLVSYAEAVELDLETFNQCVSSGQALNLVTVDYEAGQSFRLTGTPTFFIEGERLVGAQPLEVFMDAIDAELTRQGISLPGRSDIG